MRFSELTPALTWQCDKSKKSHKSKKSCKTKSRTRRSKKCGCRW